MLKSEGKRAFRWFAALDNGCCRLSFSVQQTAEAPISIPAKHRKNMTDRRQPWVLLHHQVENLPDGRGDHYDLMLSPPAAGPLWTWAIPVNPLDQNLPSKWEVQRLSNHRRVYLDYQGPVSGDRGQVQQVAKGSYETLAWSDQRIEVRVEVDDAIDQSRSFLLLLTQQTDAWQLNWSAVE